jgi:hypothetical protein
MGKKLLIQLDNIDLIEYKPLRSTPTMRITLDVGELDPEVVKTLHAMRIIGPQKLTLILAETDDLKEVVKDKESD